MRPFLASLAVLTCALLGACGRPVAEPATTAPGERPEAPPPAATDSDAADAVDQAVAADAVDPPPLRLPLAGDPVHRERLQAALAREPEADARQWIQWAAEACAIAFDARDYRAAEGLLRGILARQPRTGWAQANLSVALGKQGRYQEALAAAEAAAGLPGADPMHLAGISASWLHHLHRHAEAEALIATLQEPPRGTPRWTLYHSIQACYAASTGDEAALEQSLRHLRDVGDLGFPQRDVIFDRYRDRDWFVEIVGPTLLMVH